MTARCRLAHVLPTLALLGAVSCGGGGKSPGLDVSASVVDFAWELTGPDPVEQTLTITVTSPEAAYLGLADSPALPSWLLVGQATGGPTTFTMTLRVTADVASLGLGAHEATVRIGVARADQSVIGSRDVKVRCVVSNTFKVIGTSQDTLLVSRGAASYPSLIVLYGQDFSWQARTSAAWLKVDAASGTSPGNLRYWADTAGLAEGDYQGTVTVEEQASHRTFAIPVSLHVYPQTVLCSPDPVVIHGVVGQPLGTAQVSLTTTAGEPATFTATPGTPALRVTATGPVPGPLTISGDPAYLSPNPMSFQTHLEVCIAAGTACSVCLVQLEVTAN